LTKTHTTPGRHTGRHRSSTGRLTGLLHSTRRAGNRAWAALLLTATYVTSSLGTSWVEWLAYWPGLAFALDRMTTAIRSTVRRFLAWPLWTRLAARTGRVSRFLCRHLPILATHLGRMVRWVAVRTSRAARWTARKLWGWAGPWIQDAAGWLVHRAPGLLAHLLGRLLVRFARWAPPALARTLGWALVGFGFVLRHTAVYCIAYRDYGGIVADAVESYRPRREYALRRQWRRAAARRTLTVLVLCLLGWFGIATLIHHYGVRAELVLIIGALGVLAGIGRAVRPPKQRPEPVPGEPEIPDNAPYPIADAHTRAEAADCVARALLVEGIALRLAGEATRTGWGWTVPVILRAGTPAAIVAKTGDLETHLDLPAGGVLATPDRSRRARVVLRLAQTDPFAGIGYAPPRPPVSLSITQRAEIGRRIDGEPLVVPLLGVHGVVIGSPGAGKSSTLLALADVVSACCDAVVWDLDPAGDGLRVLGGGVARRERDLAGVEEALADALALAETRPRMLSELDMRTGVWEPSQERPAVVVLVDEYPRLSVRGKQLAVQLLRVGRKARVTLILAATEATSDALGAAIADTTALKIMHACRFPDIQLVLGPQMGAEGWRPDRLHPATADDPGDSGRCYVSTAGLREPLLAKVRPVDPDRIGELGAQRAGVGLPRIDTASWERARARRAGDRSPTDGGGAASGTPEQSVRSLVDHRGVMDVITVFGTDRRLWTEEVLVRLAALDSRYQEWSGEDLAGLLRPLDVAPKGIKREGVNRNGYDRDTITTAFQAWKDRGDRR
jgi:S-DNA-T family DNA segregation ATPase FtsK/SpoIIIE